MSRFTSRIWNVLRSSLRISSKQDNFIGSDHLGNRYFEKLEDKKRQRRASRWVETEDGRMDSAADIPIEWDAWLRYRRQEPPTQEMIDRNYVYMLRTQQKAKELEIKDKIEREKYLAEGGVDSLKSDSDKKEFPVIEEYDLKPGKHVEKPKGLE